MDRDATRAQRVDQRVIGVRAEQEREQLDLVPALVVSCRERLDDAFQSSRDVGRCDVQNPQWPAPFDEGFVTNPLASSQAAAWRTPSLSGIRGL